MTIHFRSHQPVFDSHDIAGILGLLSIGISLVGLSLNFHYPAPSHVAMANLVFCCAWVTLCLWLCSRGAFATLIWVRGFSLLGALFYTRLVYEIVSSKMPV